MDTKLYVALAAVGVNENIARDIAIQSAKTNDRLSHLETQVAKQSNEIHDLRSLLAQCRKESRAAGAGK